MPSAVSTLTKSQGAYPRTPVSKCGSTLTIFSESASALRCNPSREGVRPTLVRSPPVIPAESCPRKSRRERGAGPQFGILHGYVSSENRLLNVGGAVPAATWKAYQQARSPRGARLPHFHRTWRRSAARKTPLTIPSSVRSCERIAIQQKSPFPTPQPTPGPDGPCPSREENHFHPCRRRASQALCRAISAPLRLAASVAIASI